jgi:hypothetical protein
VRVGWAAILHNGVIEPGVFTEKDYNRPLCYLALGRLVFYETIIKIAFYSCIWVREKTSCKMQVPIEY